MRKDFTYSNREEVVQRANELTSTTLRKLYGDDSLVPAGKGSLGQLVESLHFGYDPNPSPEIDFPVAGLELKVTGVIKRRGSWRAKERLVLSNINYVILATEPTFEASSFLTANGQLLLIVYHWEPDTLPIDYRFLASGVLAICELDPKDRLIIEEDWRKIRDAVVEGRAHELSEGDTTYLAASRKGAGRGLDDRRQPNSEIPAPNRAFSFKAGFMTRLLEPILRGVKVRRDDEEALVADTAELERRSFDQIVLDRFEPFRNRTVADISSEVYPEMNPRAKGYLAGLARRMLGITSRRIEEFEKADIVMKTVRIQANGRPRESMSFPAFHYMDLVEQDWIDSDLREMWSKRFLFVFFLEDGGAYRFHHAALWAMPAADLDVEVRRVWEETVKLVEQGRVDELPNSRFSHIAHVRPHAQNARDTLPVPGGGAAIRKSFWLNAGYIAEIFEKTRPA